MRRDFEDLVVEVLGTQQELVDELQELAAAGTLDDAVVIGGRQREDLADGVVRDDLLAGTLELGRVVQRADADDGGLALGQAGHGVDRADAAGVGQGHGGARVVVSRQLAVAGPLDEVLVGVPELGEVERLRLLDVRDHQQAGAVRLGHVDGDAEVDVRRLDGDGLAVHLVVVHVHGRELGQGPDDGVADQVGEGDLAAAGTGQVGVDDNAVVDQQLGRNRPDAGGGGHLEAGDHVGGDGLGRTAEDRDNIFLGCGGCLDVLRELGRNRLGAGARLGLLRAVAGYRSGGLLRGARGSGRCRRCRRGGGRGRRGAGAAAGTGGYDGHLAGGRIGRRGRHIRDPVGSWAATTVKRFEQGPPFGIDRILVLLVTLVQFVNEPLVSAKFLW